MVPFYRDLVAEYWAAIDERVRFMTQAKPRLRLFGKVGGAIPFENSETFTADYTNALRPTRLARLDTALLDSVFKLAYHISVNATERRRNNHRLTS